MDLWGNYPAISMRARARASARRSDSSIVQAFIQIFPQTPLADHRESYILHCCLKVSSNEAKVRTRLVLIGLKILNPLYRRYRYRSNGIIHNVGGTFISRSILLCPLSHGLSSFTNAVPFQV